MIEVQCTSCHTRYRIDEQVLPEGTPTFKCSRCGHVFSVEPRHMEKSAAAKAAQRVPRTRGESKARARAEESVTEGSAKASSLQINGVPDARGNIPENRDDRENRGEASHAGPAAPAEPQPSQGPTTEELLSRTFEEPRQEAKAADNPAFEFNEERGPSESGIGDEAPAAQWETSSEPEFGGLASGAESESQEEFLVSPPSRREEELVDAPSLAAAGDFMREEAAAPIYNQEVTHSARFFLLLLLIVAVGFGTMTLAIHNAPAGAADLLSRFPMIGERFMLATTPARLVALRDVHANYARTRNGEIALIITGTAENVGVNPLHVVQIAVSLRDRGGAVAASQAVYCGNNLAANMLNQMTPHEVEFFQRLDPPKSFSLEPSASCPFLLVFVKPPAGLNGFDISVAQAVAAPGGTATPGA
jgi:predicted Zn finger-like uncharacterized protein